MKRASLVLCLLLPATSVGGTLHVPGDYPSIQSAINAAVDGDTVLVGPGLWAGPISFAGKEIVVRSSGGYAVTDIHTFS
ncbi:hypothetical protein JW921_08240, partial [Candidatus Fermentibacterales bacterium]|nr:hypothetical protein [Candidatus Fermentibacterales bacterium]